jgi:hypothetical protein
MQIYPRSYNVISSYINVYVFSYRLPLISNVVNKKYVFNKTGYIIFKHIQWLYDDGDIFNSLFFDMMCWSGCSTFISIFKNLKYFYMPLVNP